MRICCQKRSRKKGPEQQQVTVGMNLLSPFFTKRNKMENIFFTLFRLLYDMSKFGDKYESRGEGQIALTHTEKKFH